MSEVMLGVRDLAVAYEGQEALYVEELSVRKRETLTLVGPNGSGKSTLLRVLGLLVRPTRGEVWFDGRRVSYDARTLLRLRRRTAEVLQNPLLCRMSVYNNVALGLRFHGTPAREIDHRVMAWLERFQIAHLKDRRAASLSGGEAQRASLARAFVLEPEVLLLDEPFAALDPPTRQDLITELQEILVEARTTTLFATHNRGEALALGDRIAVLYGGKIVQLGVPEEIFGRPMTEEVARFVGAETLIPGHVTSSAEGLVTVDIGRDKVETTGSRPLGEPVFVCLRPEDVTLIVGNDPSLKSARNTLEGRVTKIVPSDFHLRVVVDCGVPVVAVVTKPSFRALDLHVGRRVRVSFKATAAHLLRRPEK